MFVYCNSTLYNISGIFADSCLILRNTVYIFSTSLTVVIMFNSQNIKYIYSVEFKQQLVVNKACRYIEVNKCAVKLKSYCYNIGSNIKFPMYTL